VRAIHLGVAPEDQLLEILMAGMTMKLENGHLSSPENNKQKPPGQVSLSI
jgi:hypothetical protein